MLSKHFYNKAGTSPFKIQQRMKSMYHRGIHFLFTKNLLLTNSISSGVFMGLGDLIQQEFEYHAKILDARYDWIRIGHMFIVGTIMGPLHHYYYLNLDKVLPHVNLKSVTQKIACDQVVASPLTILCFFYGIGFLEQKTLKESTEEIKLKFPMVYMGDCMYWPPIQFVNFYYLPSKYRVFYINIATMVFNVFLSFMKFRYTKDGTKL